MSTQMELSEVTLSGNQPALDLPFDHRRSHGQSSQNRAELPFTLAPDLLQQLASLADTEHVSLASVYLAGYVILLGRYSNLSELSILSSSITQPGSKSVDKCGHSENAAVVRATYLPNIAVRDFVRQISSAATFITTAEQAASCHAGFIWQTPSSDTHAFFDLSLSVQSDELTLTLSLLYRSDLFEAGTAARMSRHLIRVFEQMVADPDASLASLDMLPAAERELILGSYVGDRSDFPQTCLHQLFAEQVALRPQAEALAFGNDRLTYQQLDQRSNQIAQFLTKEGICPEDRVAIFMDRSIDMIVAMLGILKAGGAYVPIDPDYPAERLAFIAKDTSVRWVLTQRSVKAVLPTSAPSIFVDALDSPIRKCSLQPVPNRSNPESIAVVIFTSGSTGQPKAACIPHRAVIRTIRSTHYVQIVPEDRIAQASSTSFDAAIKEIWLALVNGAALVGVPRETLLWPSDLMRIIRNERINILVCNTSYVHQIARDKPEALKGLRKVLFGGEAAEPEPLRELLKHVGPGVLVNGYGPAEGCVITTYHEIHKIPQNVTAIPIGRPVSNAQIYLLDQFKRLVPMGVQGEIYIGGAGVARGYLNRPEVTAQRFLPDTFSGIPGALLYRTGDFGRMRSNGELDFRGREDDQVKIRGHRIELAEVRQALVDHTAVKQVVLLVREDNPGDKRLVAYVTLREALPAAQESLRLHAKSKLPAHMMPAAFVVVDSIPLNTHGKVDRKRLPAPSDRPELAIVYQAAETGLEAKLTQIWQQVLAMTNIGVNDNFFELGGHSLLAARLIARIEKETGHNIPVALLFQEPTIAKLAKRMTQGNYASAWSPVVELHSQENSTVAPLFCVHSLGANLVNFHKIASLMRGDRPIYGLQPHGLDGRQEPLDSIEAMASAYLKEIRTRQPHGPYYLSGVCIGGVVAYEIAQQLKAAGEEVAVLALIDSFLPGKLNHLHSRSSITEYLDWHIGEMLLLPAMARVKYFAKWLGNGGIRFGRSIGLRENSSLSRATNKVAEAHRRAISAYQPKPYDGKVVQLMCSDASHRAYEDRRLAWSSLVLGGFEIRIVPGNHLNMVEDPNARVLARELQTYLDRVDGAAGDVRRHSETSSMLHGALAPVNKAPERKTFDVAGVPAAV